MIDFSTTCVLDMDTGSTPKDLDDLVIACLDTLRGLDGRLRVYYGEGQDLRSVTAPADVLSAREWSRGKSTPPSLHDDPDITLSFGWDSDGPIGFLTVRGMWCGGLRWAFFCARGALTWLLGDPPERAFGVFRGLVGLVSPVQASWASCRDLAFIHLDLYGKANRSHLPPYVPQEYPAEAVRPGYLLPPGVLSEPFPTCVWWYNYYGPRLVEIFGREVLRGLPVCRMEETDAGGCLFSLCEEFFSIDRPDHLLRQRLAVEKLRLRDRQIERLLPQYRSSVWPSPGGH